MAKRRKKSPPRSTKGDPAKAGETQASPRLPNGRFPPGVSGNPAGKKKGTRHGLNALLEKSEEMGIDILEIALKRAMKSNGVLCKLLDKVLPSIKNIEIKETQEGQRKVIFERDDDDDTRAE